MRVLKPIYEGLEKDFGGPGGVRDPPWGGGPGGSKTPIFDPGANSNTNKWKIDPPNPDFVKNPRPPPGKLKFKWEIPILN